MLVFFMLAATNFYEKRDMEFSIEKDISENSELEKTIILKLKKMNIYMKIKRSKNSQ